MTHLCSVIIPVAPYHQDLLPRALESVAAQSVPCTAVPIHDTDRRGAGWARNRGVAQSDSLFLTFLDADDYLAPDFLERTLSHYQPGHYVYVDDWIGESLHQTPDSNVYLDGSWHSVTTLLPRSVFEAVGGFDESLPLLEDKDLYLRIQAAGICGIRCPSPLLYYTQAGQRSNQFSKHSDYARLFMDIEQRYRRSAMSCCGEGQLPVQLPPEGEKQEGDILAQALYEPQVKFSPTIPGRVYKRPKGYNDFRLWVAPSDVAARPNWWRVEQAPPPTPGLDTVMKLAGQAYRPRV